MNGFCDTPGDQERPARLYPCGWRCDDCTPGRKERSSVNAETGNDDPRQQAGNDNRRNQ